MKGLKYRNIELNPFDEVKTYEVFFTFSYNGSNYAVTREKGKKKNVCSVIRWNGWRGATLRPITIRENEPAAAEYILGQGELYPAKFPLSGEHYTVQGDIKRLGTVNKGGECTYLDTVHKSMPFFVRAFAALVLVLVATLIHSAAFGLNYAQTVFPEASTGLLNVLIWIPSLMFGLIPYFLNRKRRNLLFILLNSIIAANFMTMVCGCKENIVVLAATLLAFVAGFSFAIFPTGKSLINSFFREHDKKKAAKDLMLLLAQIFRTIQICIVAATLTLIVMNVVSAVQSRKAEQQEQQ